MASPEPFEDDFPRPRRSPRLYGSADSIGGGTPTRLVPSIRLSDAKLRRLRDMAIIEACRSALPPVPYATLVARLEISERQARRLYKLAKAMKLRCSHGRKSGR